ncbi:flagellin [Candidatus Odyssella thessalonicensis]|uniref:flagellin n=1 Tax=Candidatus Odyssella thessalonicensis TaxID=84647 RepID=UPI000225A8BC|nr:flagellin [Candidatus Odyssella thessalonicensis]
MVSAATNLGANAAKRYLEINTQKATRATEELASGFKASNPSYDPSSSAVGYRLTANVQSLVQASSNVAQATAMIQMATGSLGATQEVLTRLKELTAKANTDGVGDGERKMMNEEFQQLLNQVTVNALSARWGGVSLFSGGVGTSTANGTVAEAAMGLNVTTNAFAGTLNATNTQGNISGVALDATVVANGSLYEVTVVVGEQTFKAMTSAPLDGGQLTLVSISDPTASISLDYLGSGVAVPDATIFQSELRQALGISPSLARATFTSLSTGAAAIGTSLIFSPGAATAAGTWAMTYDYNATTQTGTFRISSGSEYYTTTLDALNPMTTTVSFPNGINLSLNNFDGTTNLAQETFTVTAGSQIVQSFQYGDKASDMLTVVFQGASTAALKLNNLTILTKAAAQIASRSIDNAQDQVGSMIAELGGKASQLNFMADTLKISIQNQTAARSTFVDADIAESMLTLQRFKGLAQVANTVFTQALNEQSNLTTMVQNVR